MSDPRAVTYQQLLDTDTHDVPAVLRIDSRLDGGLDRIPIERYTSRAFFELEVERLWRRVWQMACREEDIPEVGDQLVYDIAGLSILVVRVASDRIKAYWNACLHRGRALRDERGRAGTIRCPFHGWCWKLDGSLAEVPAGWDFPHVDWDANSLPEVQVDTWGGFVFVNPDPDASPLAEHLGDLPAHFTRWPLEKRYKAAHVAKILRCNWKVAQEAFMEAYHVVGTHPQLMVSLGDSNTQNDVFETFSRSMTPNGTPSPHVRERPSEQELADGVLDLDYEAPSPVTIPEGSTARTVLAERRRDVLRPVLGEGVDELCDAELMDSFYYTLFPNLHPWGAYNRIVYRFRPLGTDHRQSIMEVMFLEPLPEGPRPKAAPIHWLGPDEDWVEAPELGMLARVFNQDNFNLPRQQIGLETSARSHVQVSKYNESRLRHFHGLLDRWLSPD